MKKKGTIGLVATLSLIHIQMCIRDSVEAARQGATLSGAEVTVIDSGFTDQAMKFQVVEAAKLAKEGADLDTVLARIEEVKEKTELYLSLIHILYQ